MGQLIELQIIETTQDCIPKFWPQKSQVENFDCIIKIELRRRRELKFTFSKSVFKKGVKKICIVNLLQTDAK